MDTMERKKSIFWWGLGIFFVSWFSVSTLWADGCSTAAEHYKQALSQPSLSEKERLLKETTDLCPTHAEAWNDFGYTREQQGRVAEAENHYRRAIQVNPSLTVAYAGLGDVQNIQKNHEQAAKNYQEFLRLLDEEVKRGDPIGLNQFRVQYEQKLAVVNKKLGGENIISAHEITRALSEKPSKTRGYERMRAIHPHYKDKAAIDIRIQFDFGSSQMKASSVKQFEMLFNALRSSGLKGNTIKIIGHTDSVGSERDNLGLSRRRAESIKRALVERGIEVFRLKTEGRGELEPVESNETEEGRAKNRRVTCVNVESR